MIIEQPFQYRQLRSQSLSPYNDRNLIKQLKKQLQQPKYVPQSSFEYVYPPEQASPESQIISQGTPNHHLESIQQYCRQIKLQKNSVNLTKDIEPVRKSLHSSDTTRIQQPQLIIVKKRNQKPKKKKQIQINPVNPQECNDDELNTTQQATINVSTIDNNQHNRSILPQIKRQKLQIEEQPIKRSARLEQLMKKTCQDHLSELKALIRKMEKPLSIKKEKKVTFLL